MEIRCTKCGHLGAASAVQPVAGGVGLVCGECGFVNELAMDAASKGPTRSDREEKERQDRARKRAEVVEEMVERLLPEPGVGPRCRKCAYLFEEESEHCSRCGLSVADGARYEDGEAPWERPPPGKAQAHEQAQNLWASIEERQNSEKIEDFVDFVLEEELVDFGIRKIQHFMVDHQEDDHARQGLERLAVALERTLTVARTQAKASAESFQGEVQRLRSLLMIGALVFSMIILVLLSLTFWDKF